MKCEKCENKIEEGQKFCSNCGEFIKIDEKIDNIELESDTVSQVGPIIKEANNQMREVLLIFGIGILIIVSFIVYPSIQNSLKLKQEAKDALVAKEQEEALAKENELLDIKSKLTELENKKPQIIYKETTPKEKTTVQITKEWSLQVVNIYCLYNYSNGTFNTVTSGSGFVVKYISGNIGVMTNKHVLFLESQYRPAFCTAYFLNGEKYTTNWDEESFGASANYDVGNLTLNDLSDSVKKIANKNDGKVFCSDKPDIGDNIVVLGYPGIGSSQGITVTEGIISGIENDYYVTSAKIDHGNSGGIAISAKNNCIIGMPSSALSGKIESLGRILSSKILMAP